VTWKLDGVRYMMLSMWLGATIRLLASQLQEHARMCKFLSSCTCRYLVTWKADGVRYMMLITQLGAYLIDRKFAVRRLQLRFPTPAPKPPGGGKLKYPVGTAPAVGACEVHGWARRCASHLVSFRMTYCHEGCQGIWRTT
jgi:hypothetical protein